MKEMSRASNLILLAASVLCVAASCAAPATSQPSENTRASAPAASSSGDSAAPTQQSSPSNASATATPEVPPRGAVETEAAKAPTFADWPQWRGINRDGLTVGISAPQTWPKELKEHWRVKVGIGHASPVVAGGRVYQFARQGEEEVLLALDAATGREIWRNTGGAPVPYEMNSAARDHGKGPKSTPVVSGGKVFTLGITGILSAHDAASGKLIWRKDFSKQYPTTSPLYGTAMSPIVEKNLLIAHVGGQDRGALVAFDAATGAVRWSYDADGPAYSSPVVATFGGERQVVTFTQKEFVSVNASTGKLLWKLPAKTHYDTNCNTAVVYKDMLIFSLEGQGVVAVRPVRAGAGWTTQEVWRNSENELYMNSPVLHGTRLFGLSVRRKGQFFALDAETGKTLWQGPGRAGENAAIINLDGMLLALTNDANLIALPANAKDYEPAARYTVANSPTWAHPVVFGDRILVKDETTLASLALK
jgi:outer membrane protein assembly factor BamB